MSQTTETLADIERVVREWYRRETGREFPAAVPPARPPMLPSLAQWAPVAVLVAPVIAYPLPRAARRRRGQGEGASGAGRADRPAR